MRHTASRLYAIVPIFFTHLVCPKRSSSAIISDVVSYAEWSHTLLGWAFRPRANIFVPSGNVKVKLPGQFYHGSWRANPENEEWWNCNKEDVSIEKHQRRSAIKYPSWELCHLPFFCRNLPFCVSWKTSTVPTERIVCRGTHVRYTYGLKWPALKIVTNTSSIWQICSSYLKILLLCVAWTLSILQTGHFFSYRHGRWTMLWPSVDTAWRSWLVRIPAGGSDNTVPPVTVRNTCRTLKYRFFAKQRCDQLIFTIYVKRSSKRAGLKPDFTYIKIRVCHKKTLAMQPYFTEIFQRLTAKPSTTLFALLLCSDTFFRFVHLRPMQGTMGKPIYACGLLCPSQQALNYRF